MIHIFSSFANDIITYEHNRVIPGWPALWISKVMEDLKIKHKFYTGTTGEVIIAKDGNGEDKGIITKVYPIPHLSHIDEKDIIIISTLQQEFSLSEIIRTTNDIFIDIQGFLRWDFWRKKRFDCRAIQTRGDIFIKATREEFSYLDDHEDVRHTFIVTNGWDDIELISSELNKKISIRSEQFRDTIGAGDTFFSSLCVFYEKNKDIENAVRLASEYTYVFLSKKNNSYSS